MGVSRGQGTIELGLSLKAITHQGWIQDFQGLVAGM